VAAEHATQPFHVYLDRWLETAQKVAVGAAEQACGPREARVPRRLAGAVEDLDHEPIRIAPDKAGAAAIAGQHLDCLDRHGPGCHVHTEHDQVNPRLLDLRQDRLQGGHVAMDVAKHRDAHPTIMPFGRPDTPAHRRCGCCRPHLPRLCIANQGTARALPSPTQRRTSSLVAAQARFTP
jgi:hypothetical protein